MRILQVSPRYPPQTGGVETQVRELSERLVHRGHEVLVITADAGGDGERREWREGVEVRRYSSVAPGGAYHLAPGLGRSVRRTDADIVHGHNAHSFPLLQAAQATGSIPFVATTTYHGSSAKGLRNLLWRAYRPLLARALASASTVVAVSDWEADRLDQDFGIEAGVVPIGLNLDRFDEIEPIDRDRPYLICVARLVRYKGVQQVIRSLPKLPEYDLIVAGTGPYESELKNQVETLRLTDRVEFLGFTPPEDLPEYYAGASVYLSLSTHESFGITVAEALASGTPCVVRTGSGLEGWLANQGVVGVDEVNPTGLARAVKEALDREPDDKGIADWTEVVDQYEEIYGAL